MFEFCIRYRYRLNLTLNVCFVWTLFVFDIPSLSLSLQFQSIHFAVYLARVCAASLHLHSVTVLTSLLSLIFFLYSQSSPYTQANNILYSTCKLMHNKPTNWFPFFLFLDSEYIRSTFAFYGDRLHPIRKALCHIIIRNHRIDLRRKYTR